MPSRRAKRHHSGAATTASAERKQLARSVRAFMDATGITQGELARQLGASQPSISRLLDEHTARALSVRAIQDLRTRFEALRAEEKLQQVETEETSTGGSTIPPSIRDPLLRRIMARLGEGG